MLRKLFLTLFSLWMIPAAAAGWSFVPQQSGPQKEFVTLLEKGQWRQALIAWNQSFSGTSFANSSNGAALHSYLLLQNGLPLIASESVLQLNAKDLSPEVIEKWKPTLETSAYVQKAWVNTHKTWHALLGASPINPDLSTRAKIRNAMKQADRLPKDRMREKAALWWQIATRAPLIDETSLSLEALQKLKESGQTQIGADQISLATARVLYQRGDIDNAIKSYKEVPKSSDLWLQSVEERAWGFLRKNDFDQALGEVTTLLAPTFEKMVGPEPYYLTNLLALKVCDYPRIFKTSDLFKNRHRTRLAELQTIAQQGTGKSVTASFDKMDQKGVNFQALGPHVEFLPRTLLKDREFNKHMGYRHALLQELKSAQKLQEETAALGANAELDRMVMESKMKLDDSRARAMSRLRQLAQMEVKEFKQNVNKLHIIEAQVIERLHLDDNLKGPRSQLAQIKDQGDVMVFPYNDEVWLDELDNYKARVKDCPTLKGASL